MNVLAQLKTGLNLATLEGANTLYERIREALPDLTRDQRDAMFDTAIRYTFNRSNLTAIRPVLRTTTDQIIASALAA